MFHRISSMKSFSRLTEKTLAESELRSFARKRTPLQRSSKEVCNDFQNIFYMKTLGNCFSDTVTTNTSQCSQKKYFSW